MKNVLIIGNGFDITHGLKTGYKDFVDFCECIKDYLYEINCIENNTINYEIIEGNLGTLESKMVYKNIHKTIQAKFMLFLNDTRKSEVDEYLLGCCDNYWLQYIYENKSRLGDRWCDLEYLIGEMIEAHAIVASHPNQTSADFINKKNFDQINTIIEEFTNNDGETYYSSLINHRDKMFKALEDLTWMLEQYLDCFFK